MANIDEIAREVSAKKQKRKNAVGRLVNKLAAIAQDEKNNAESLMSHMGQSDLPEETVDEHIDKFLHKVETILPVLGDEHREYIDRLLAEIDSTKYRRWRIIATTSQRRTLTKARYGDRSSTQTILCCVGSMRPTDTSRRACGRNSPGAASSSREHGRRERVACS